MYMFYNMYMFYKMSILKIHILKMYICSNILYKYGNIGKYKIYFNTSIRV